MRSLTAGFSWFAGAVFGVHLVVAGRGPFTVLAAVMVALVLGAWWLWSRHDGWLVVAAEGVAVAVSFLVLPVPQPIVGFLFGVTVRRALLHQAGRFRARAFCPPAGYLVGLGLTLAAGDGAAWREPGVLVSALVPLAGLVIEAVLLQAAVRAAHSAEVARGREEELRVRSERDELTGLVARTRFLDVVDEVLARAPGPVALLVVDLDGFREVNDAEGHEVGDRWLVVAARRLRAALDPRHVLARLGGDEFAVLAADHGEQHLVLARRMLSALAQPADPGEGPSIRASIGIAVSGRAGTGASSGELLRDADTAMYAAKRDGGGRARVFTRQMGEQVLARQRDTTALRAALAGDQLVVHYQPIIDLTTGRVARAEALVRWQRPGWGLVAPGGFIGLAEETGLIVPLGDHVLRAACAQAARWQALGSPLGVAVNVSTGQLAADGFGDAVTGLLAATGLAPDRLTLEVTESVWADEDAMRVLMGIRDTGVRLALDDFGTGYSSLSYLQRYPFDVVKVDRSFTAGLGRDDRTEGVVRCIVDLASVLGARTVAEGVETPEQADWLRGAGCDFAQGFLYGVPDLADNWHPRPSRADHLSGTG